MPSNETLTPIACGRMLATERMGRLRNSQLLPRTPKIVVHRGCDLRPAEGFGQ
jgi:hypothetical protein